MQYLKPLFLPFILSVLITKGFAQSYWQQKVDYQMDIDFDVARHQFKGIQKLTYFNDSPDTLHKVFYHLYFNAFQPGSMMDIRSRTIEDPDKRVGDRIYHLNGSEIGFQKIKSLKHNGKDVQYEVVGTILEVTLNQAIRPGTKAVFNMEFEAQVPLQIRRSGRDNEEGIAYSMTQWYPKMCEYDEEGWHANPYVGREFHGVWGNFDVTIHIDSTYTLGGTGYLKNPQEVGHGYENKSKKLKLPQSGKLSWHFNAPNVHDFAWAADPDYVHEITQIPDGPTLHFLYQKGPETKAWADLQNYAVKTFQIMSSTFGKYPYEQYTVLQGGDGGMEYPMATLITGNRSLGSLVGVVVHESIHSWYQMVLATNEAKYPWMDEGFTTYATDFVMNQLFERNSKNPHAGSYSSYVALTKIGQQEPLTTHADHFITNRAYGISSYSKGAVFLHQLSYIVGEEVFFKGMRAYFNEWKFKHPNPSRFKRVMEKVSGLELDWYFEHWVGTTNTIDYSIKSVCPSDEYLEITLEKIGVMPMPIDLSVTHKDGSKEIYHIPLRIMRGEKINEFKDTKFHIMEDWPWTFQEYVLKIPKADYAKIEIDESLRMADIDRKNNVYPHEGNAFNGNK